MLLPAAVLRFKEKLDDEPWKQLALGEMRRSFEKRTMGLAPGDHFIGQHLALGRDEPIRPALGIEGHRNFAVFEQTENIAGGLGRNPALVRNHIVLGPVPSRDVILG